ncbi:MaoC family dehydratase [Actinospica sp. MGRD01-02]|uniref:MaoC family dehydratase n=1 Tax=Actinospica acidithermotolerans TaxID=2828514 RepID=A0A941E7E3_9ACTN|nr:MaoC family dehydratase [Actinospica acidithermotolerans]MBR7827720.1 MaoC family dehydratase [Actinospica acidithermotolerans]
MSRTIQAAELKSLVGQEIGVSDWLAIDQKRIDTFAEATGDHQWIHVDPERAAEGPFGATIAHGYLTLSLISALAWGVYTIEGARLTVNYGLNKVRFISPVTVGSRIRARLALSSVEDVPGDALQVMTTVTMELEDAAKPAAVAETLARIYL